MRDNEWVGDGQPPAWLGAAVPGAVRLAAEARTEADDVLAGARAGAVSSEWLTRHVVRIEQSAGLTAVATDLAGLLWAECEDVPRIDTILEEPAARAALEAVAEARRCAGHRLSVEAAASTPRLVPPADVVRPDPVIDVPAAATALAGAPVTGQRLVVREKTPALPRRRRRPLAAAAGLLGSAVVAGAAATAILIFGRHLRRA